VNKILKPLGASGQPHETPNHAVHACYLTRDGQFPPTNLDFDSNPLNNEIPTADIILDFGCGVGRNLPWIMEKTKAKYIGIDPNPSMRQFFWAIQDPKYLNRVELYPDIASLPEGMHFDVVLSTFTLQHIGYMTMGDTMDTTDIIKALRAFTTNFTIWIALENDTEDPGWITRMTTECEMAFIQYERNFKGLPELTHRGDFHLMIWQD
jgi:SAM-dependent methyltransferase